MLTKDYFRDLYNRTISLGLDASKLVVDGSTFIYNSKDDSLILDRLGETVGREIGDVLVIPDCIDYLSSNWSKDLSNLDSIKEFYADSVKAILLESDYDLENPYSLPKLLSVLSLKSFKTIEVALFENMKLTSLTLSDDLDNIYGYAFINCEINDLHIKNVKRLARNSFSQAIINHLEIENVEVLNARAFIRSNVNTVTIGNVGSVYVDYNTIIKIEDGMNWRDYMIFE